jgi:hypothetical protein
MQAAKSYAEHLERMVKYGGVVGARSVLQLERYTPPPVGTPQPRVV